MIYTDSGKYAVRAVAYLAAHAVDDELISAAQIAEAESIPPFYLSKILKDLARVGILKSVRGRRGGFRLNSPADEIPVMTILEAVENIRPLTEDCILGIAACNDAAPCPIHDTWSAFRQSFVDTMNTLTVADLERELRRKRQGKSG